MELLRSNVLQLETYQKELICKLKDDGIMVKSYNRSRDNTYIIIKFNSIDDLTNAINYTSELSNKTKIEDLSLKIFTL